MWIKMGCRLLNLDQMIEIRAVRRMSMRSGQFEPEWRVEFDPTDGNISAISLPMDSEDEARRMVEDIAEAMHGGANLIYWYKDQE